LVHKKNKKEKEKGYQKGEEGFGKDIPEYGP
jgi:hypothetical protein